MKNKKFSRIVVIIFNLVILVFGCKPDNHYEIDEKEVQKWDSETVSLIHKYCDRKDATFYFGQLEQVLKIGVRNKILNYLFKRGLPCSKEIHYKEYYVYDSGYHCNVWFDDREILYSFEYYERNDSISMRIRDEKTPFFTTYIKTIRDDWGIDTCCCRIELPIIFSVLKVGKGNNISNIEIKGLEYN